MSTAEAPGGVLVSWMVPAKGTGTVRHIAKTRARPFAASAGIMDADLPSRASVICNSRASEWRRLTEEEAAGYRTCTGCARIAAREVVREAERALWLRNRAAQVVERIRYNVICNGPATQYGICDGEPERVKDARETYRSALLFLAHEIEETMLGGHS